MKALEILRKAELETNCGKLYSDSGTAIATEKEIDEAIAEIKALLYTYEAQEIIIANMSKYIEKAESYKTCDGCKHDNDGYCTKYYNDKYGRVDCSRLTEDRYEPKE